MFCPTCGSATASDTLLCPRCDAAPLTVVPTDVVRPSPSAGWQPPPNAKPADASEWRARRHGDTTVASPTGYVPPMAEGDPTRSRGDAWLRITSLIALTVIVMGMLYRVFVVFSGVQQTVEHRRQPAPVHPSTGSSRAEPSR